MKNLIKTAAIAAALSLTALAASATGMNTSMSQAMGHFSPMSSETSQLIHLKGGATLHQSIFQFRYEPEHRQFGRFG
jgi:Spy/CpxP family protein refolding chaperone